MHPTLLVLLLLQTQKIHLFFYFFDFLVALCLVHVQHATVFFLSTNVRLAHVKQGKQHASQYDEVKMVLAFSSAFAELSPANPFGRTTNR